MYPAGWYADPQTPSNCRGWDGHQWTGQVRSSVATEGDESSRMQQHLAAIRAQIVEAEDVMLLQEVGIYEYSHPLKNSAAYKGALKALLTRINTYIREARAGADVTQRAGPSMAPPRRAPGW